jgi:hypothetical protein
MKGLIGWIANVVVVAGFYGSTEYKESEKMDLMAERDSAYSFIDELSLQKTALMESNANLANLAQKLILENDSLKVVIVSPKPERKCPDCPPSLPPFKAKDHYYVHDDSVVAPTTHGDAKYPVIKPTAKPIHSEQK